MLTLEQIEARIIDRLRDGQGQCVGINACMYRYNGNTCAVGCLIKDEHYDSRFEGRTINSPLDNALVAALRKSGVPTDQQTLMLLAVWQQRHDNPSNWNGTEYTGPTTSLIFK